ncbi:hypothetical protein ACHWQZ_G008201 [Mnemiopsis leidyi]
MLNLWMVMLVMFSGQITDCSVEIFKVSPTEQESSQVFTATKKYGDSSEFVVTGIFKPTSGNVVVMKMSTLKIGDPLDGSFSDNNNRAYGIAMDRRSIFVWAFNPSQETAKETAFKKDGEPYRLMTDEEIELTIQIQQNGNLFLSALRTEGISLTITKDTFTFIGDKINFKDTYIKLEVVQNDFFVITSIRATSEGSSDELICQAGQMKTGDDQCQSCTEGTYSTDGLNCEPCPATSTSVKGTTSVAECKCPADHYMNSETCWPCLDGHTADPGSTLLADCSLKPVFNVSPTEKASQQVFTATKKYGESSEFVVTAEESTAFTKDGQAYDLVTDEEIELTIQIQQNGNLFLSALRTGGISLTIIKDTFTVTGNQFQGYLYQAGSSSERLLRNNLNKSNQ